MAEAEFFHGSPLMVDYIPSGAVAAGTVVLVDGKPRVAHLDIAANGLGALAHRGGVYRMIAAGNYAPGNKVYWNHTSKKITTAVGSHPHFGTIVPSSDPAADGSVVYVEHDPDGTATAAE